MTELAHDGDRAARDVIALIGMRLGVGDRQPRERCLTPSVVVIGGGVVAAGDLLLEPARTVVRERALPPSRDVVRIVPVAVRRGVGDARRRAARAATARPTRRAAA